ncbi:MAG TPA: class I SAM-dependent methyltransferase [Bacteroidales bacterium]|nr:class I SAM-dependent methyltransferase [Bacteroidales bacterium]HPF02394.1 class I SAM-dependent methyltransferase [Bacteroidales bacterium]HPJ58923.1 class I SAM-dependent methyltransferase [Bacteroidales bacterium]HPR12177.1 class I SAM-dependent methyltransferase [Bacteroidales bacterium]HRW84860.1 class I SAM-dependent methyltransferase [Bacteroidales bacterium]
MNEFDLKASAWDNNPMHLDRSASVSREIIKRIKLNKNMRALEFGAGTGITSFLLKDHVKEIIMLDSSSGMAAVMNEKISISEVTNLRALYFDLENQSFTDGTFDLIFTQMALHHVLDVEDILKKFSLLLNPRGFIAIADLYPEDGSFHGPEFSGHKGFSIKELSTLLAENGFINISEEPCFTINKKTHDGSMKSFDLFLMIAQKA